MMLMREGYRPECNIQIEQTNVTAEGVGDLHIETERGGGMLDRLGVGHQGQFSALSCPDCGVMQLYADCPE